jgi:predicted AAA+ superfamily ATPase
LALGSIPNENLPTKSHEDPTPAEPRRPLIRSKPSTWSSTSSHMMQSKEQFKVFVKKISKENLVPWKVDMSNEDKV